MATCSSGQERGMQGGGRLRIGCLNPGGGVRMSQSLYSRLLRIGCLNPGGGVRMSQSLYSRLLRIGCWNPGGGVRMSQSLYSRLCHSPSTLFTFSIDA